MLKLMANDVMVKFFGITKYTRILPIWNNSVRDTENLEKFGVLTVFLVISIIK